MKRLISTLLVTAMLISALPTLVFADEENNFTENAVETTAEEMPGLGSEATIGNVVFYIEDGTLFRSENNARPKTVDENVSWIIEDNNKFYWSKLEEHSTSSIYFCSANDITGEVLTKLFVPVEAFDIDGNDLYYLYNGEIVKSNMVSGKEEVVLLDKSIRAFYFDGDSIKEVSSKGMSNDEKTQLLSFDGISYQEQICKVTYTNKCVTGWCNVASLVNLLRRKAIVENVPNANYTVKSVLDGLGFSYEVRKCAKSSHTNPQRTGYYTTGGTTDMYNKADYVSYTDENNLIKCGAVCHYGLSSNKLKGLLDKHPEGVFVRYFNSRGEQGRTLYSCN